MSTDYEYTGNFEQDYTNKCSKENIEPFLLKKVGIPAEPNTNSSKTPRPQILLQYSATNVLWGIQIRYFPISVTMFDILCGCIAACTSITHLVLLKCDLTDACTPTLSSLLENGNLVNIKLDQNPLPNESQLFNKFFSVDSSLRFLSLRFNAITDATIQTIVPFMKTNRNLVSLDLFGNDITSEGLLALSEALKWNNTLLSLNLANNKITNYGILGLGKALSKYQITLEDIQLKKKMAKKEDEKLKSKEQLDQITKEKTEKKDAAKKGTFSPTKTSKKEEKTKATDKEKKPETSSKTKAAGPVLKSQPSFSKSKRAGKGGLAEDENETFIQLNGLYYAQGNRNLANLNLYKNDLSENALKYLSDAIQEQEQPLFGEMTADMPKGLIRLTLSDTLKSNLLPSLLRTVQTRNPFVFQEKSEKNILDATI